MKRVLFFKLSVSRIGYRFMRTRDVFIFIRAVLVIVKLLVLTEKLFDKDCPNKNELFHLFIKMNLLQSLYKNKDICTGQRFSGGMDVHLIMSDHLAF